MLDRLDLMHRWRYARRMLPVPINCHCFIYWTTLLLIYIFFLNLNLSGCLALPSPAIKASSMSVGGDVKHKSETGHVVNLTRQHNADVFTAIGMSTCNADTCVGLSSGTAEQNFFNSDKTSGITSNPHKRKDSTSLNVGGVCECGCLPYLSTYREDLGICVDDIHECTLSPFVSGSSSEKIPFVFLPLRGQIIYPSREISFSDIRTPVCAVTGSQYLTTTGWVDLRNPIDTDFPFRMFRDEGRTFLQWLGEPDLRNKMQGRLILVHLMCRDMSALPVVLNNEKLPTQDGSNQLKNIFTPCVAFRVNGSPVKYFHNVSEVLFQSETTSTLSSTADGMSTKEYIVIGVCSLLLGLIYVASVFLYLHVKKRKSQSQQEISRSSIDDLANEINYPKNDQVTFGAPFTRAESVYSLASLTDHRNSQRSHRNSGNSVNLNEEMTGVIKNNPLLKHYPNLGDHNGFASDISNSASECEDGSHVGKHDKIKNVQASVIVHPSQNCNSDSERNFSMESPPSPTQENECHPQSNVSIVEDMLNEEKLESMRAIANGTVRKKLYFNPAYFEPHLLASPPPAAIEFLSKIREVIAIAKYKMGSKRYQPTLIMIPEEGTYKNSDASCSQQKNLEQNSGGSIFITTPTDCKRCSPNHLGGIPKNTSSKKCNNCGDKRNSIEKWLETVTIHDNKSNKQVEGDIIVSNEKCNNFEKKSPSPSNSNGKKSPSVSYTSESNSSATCGSKSLRKKDISPPKSKPPPIPTTAPKIISHSLKPHINSVSVETKLNSSVPASRSQRENSNPKTPSPNSISVTRHFDGENIYTFAETGNEIYNNPKFSELDSPKLLMRKKDAAQNSKIPSNAMVTNKKFEIFDQYSNTTFPESEQKRYELMRNIKKMPDMVYEALTRDYSLRPFPTDKINVNSFNIPTPDYDSTMEKNIKDIYNNTQGSVPSVPTPDYSTLSKKSLRHYQPDSPVYRRRSPQYLIVDYETDSLERSTTKRKCSSSSSPSSNNSSDISSQPSPSLSTALPLEEEVEVRHTIYDRIDGFRKDGDSNIKKRVAKSEFDAANNAKKEIAARIKYDTPFRGSMTIEVEHEPLSDLELSTDSDQFEPDTLDRKPKKHSFCDVTNVNAWSEHLKKSKNFVNSIDGHVSYSSLENMTSLPDFSTIENEIGTSQLILRSTNSFRTSVEGNNCIENEKNKPTKGTNLESRPSFGSLREIYQSKIQRLNHPRPKLSSLGFADDQGRLLTLEAKHTRRQRAIFKEDNPDKNAMPPDVIPPGNDNKTKNIENGIGNGNYYDLELCKEPSNKNDDTSSSNESSSNGTKNCRGWNSGNFTENHIDNNNFRDDMTNGETTSNHSASTEITGVSDTHGNSEFEETSWERHVSPGLHNDIISLNQMNERTGQTSRLGNLRNDYSFNKYLNRKKSSDSDEVLPVAIGSDDDNPDKIEILSTRSISSRSDSKANSVIYGGTHSDTNSISKLTSDQNTAKIQTVYRVEVSSPTNGMQIALGLRDRGKKTKDLKNAWKKFVSLATSRFNPNVGSAKDSELYDKKSSFLESIEKDEGIASLIDDNALISHTDNYSVTPDNPNKANGFPSITSGVPMRGNLFYYDPQRFGNQRQELDSGYMSADSSEVYNRRCYDRYNFKMMTEKDHIIKVDTIEDNSDCMVDNEDGCRKSNGGRSIKSNRSSNKKSKCEASHDNRQPNDDHDDRNHQTNNIGNIYSLEDERYKSPSCATSESEDDEANMDDMCESGAESIETHSVLYKNIRKNDLPNGRSDNLNK